MPFKSLEREESLNFGEKPDDNFTLSLSSPENFLKAEEWLRPLIGAEETEQLVFVLRSMADDDHANQCHEASRNLGLKLAQRFGEEESFFDLSPSAEFYLARSYSPLDKLQYRGEHSVGLLEFRRLPKPLSLSIDLTYGDVSRRGERDSVLMLNRPGAGKEAIKMLTVHYGGSWKKEFKFNKDSGRFIFQGK